MPRDLTVLMAIVAAVALFAQVPARAQEPADPSSLKTFDFMLGEVHYRILLPKHASLMARSGTDRFHVSLSTRALRQLELQPARGEAGRTYPRSQNLSNGAVLAFDIVRDAEGYTGSGGPEETLEGQLQIGDRTLAVKCHDQAEWPGAPRPAWCISYLHHLTVVAGR